MKRQPKPKPRVPVSGAKGQNALPAGSTQLLRKGRGKKRVAISPSQPHSKRFGH